MSVEPIIEEVTEVQENKNNDNILKANTVAFNQINLLNNNDHSNSVNNTPQTKWQYLKHKLNSLSNSKRNVNAPLHTKIAKKIFAFIGTFIVSISSASILLNLLHFFTYQQQLDIIASKNFSFMSMIWYGIFCGTKIILDVLSTAHDGEKMNKKFGSIWVPFLHAINISLLLPDSHGVSAFSYFVKMIVSFWTNF